MFQQICRNIKDQYNTGDDVPETHFFGVFDGHAGGKCSKAISSTIPQQLIRDEAFNTKLPLAIKRAIQKTNEQFLEIAGRMRLNDGSTGVCVLLRGKTLICANVGDSRAILVSNRRCVPLSEDHKPTLPSEQKRIASFGGTITYNTGIARVAGVLAVSRAFGNNGIRNLIRADADVIQRDLTADDHFVVIASDGLWDVFRNNEVCDVCYSMERQGVQRTADHLVQMSLSRGSMDNVTCLVIQLSKYFSRISHVDSEYKNQRYSSEDLLSMTAGGGVGVVSVTSHAGGASGSGGSASPITKPPTSSESSSTAANITNGFFSKLGVRTNSTSNSTSNTTGGQSGYVSTTKSKISQYSTEIVYQQHSDDEDLPDGLDEQDSIVYEKTLPVALGFGDKSGNYGAHMHMNTPMTTPPIFQSKQRSKVTAPDADDKARDDRSRVMRPRTADGSSFGGGDMKAGGGDSYSGYAVQKSSVGAQQQSLFAAPLANTMPLPNARVESLQSPVKRPGSASIDLARVASNNSNKANAAKVTSTPFFSGNFSSTVQTVPPTSQSYNTSSSHHFPDESDFIIEDPNSNLNRSYSPIITDKRSLGGGAGAAPDRDRKKKADLIGVGGGSMAESLRKSFSNG